MSSSDRPMYAQPAGANVAPVTNALDVLVTATELIAGTAALAERKQLWIANMSGVTIYLGDSSVTTSTGFPLNAGEKIQLDCSYDRNIAWYAIAPSTAAVRVMEVA